MHGLVATRSYYLLVTLGRLAKTAMLDLFWRKIHDPRLLALMLISICVLIGVLQQFSGEGPKISEDEERLPIEEADLLLLIRLVHAEARAEPYSGQVAVAAVVLNRLLSPLFPDTIPGVIYQPGAFTVVTNGQINLEPNEEAKRAAIDAISGWDPSEGAVYFYNPQIARSPWLETRPKTKIIGQHVFTK
ncbi:MAG: cell wall hydrolase [Methanothrix sp.]|jgi:hypothetical protein|nr:cell wall hydrolase [Methanothrix sp.]